MVAMGVFLQMKPKPEGAPEGPPEFFYPEGQMPEQVTPVFSCSSAAAAAAAPSCRPRPRNITAAPKRYRPWSAEWPGARCGAAVKGRHRSISSQKDPVSSLIDCW